jgi:uncharacterized membrane protein YcfT
MGFDRECRAPKPRNAAGARLVKNMWSSLGRAALWLVSASVLLLAGFASIVTAMYFLGLATGSIAPGQTEMAQKIMKTYFRVVFFKGLLPQLLLALAFWPALRRLCPWVERSRSGMAVGLALAAALAYAVVAPLLLTAEYPDWPALQMHGLYHHVGSGVLMTGAVVLAGLVARLVVPGLRPRADSEPQPRPVGSDL